jgi:hypothetical protein
MKILSIDCANKNLGVVYLYWNENWKQELNNNILLLKTTIENYKYYENNNDAKFLQNINQILKKIQYTLGI